jgi:2-keto-3-deoxy-L-rhamnonate aldolase RhmA
MTLQLPQFAYSPRAHSTVISEANSLGSTVFVMIETKQALLNLDAIASVPGVDVLLVGSNDLSVEMGIPGDFEQSSFRDALTQVSRVCKAHGKIMALAGIYDREAILTWAVRELGVAWILGGQDASFVAKGAGACVGALTRIEGK